MEIIEVSNDLQISSIEIKQRIEQSLKNSYTRHYLVKDNGDEIAFMSLDLMHDRKLLYLYELFVLIPKRRMGHAYGILDLVFEYAIKESFEEIYVDPHPFDGTIPLKDLKKIYINKGFIAQKETSEMSKKISK